MATRRKTSLVKKSRKKSSSGRSPHRQTWRFLAKWTAVAVIWGVIAGGVMLGFYAHDLPDISGLGTSGRRPSIALADREGKIFATFGEFHGAPITVSQLPVYLPQAVMAIEDRRFYDHIGIDSRGVLRAMVTNIRAGRLRQGGSTLTQQLAKILFLTPDRTIKRKVQELILAFQLENRFTKDEIFSIYLNRVYLGGGAYGVEAAAQKYFGVPVREITLYQAAMLAGLLQAPSRYNPAANPDAARARATQVLDAMVVAGYLTPADRQAAELKGMGTLAVASSGLGKHFADWTVDQIGDYVSFGDRDLVVRTTLDLRLQTIAGVELAAILDGKGAEAKVGEAALVSLSPDGAVRAMVGGRDYDQSQFNRATQAQRQPGSSFKPFVFLAGLEAEISPDDEFDDQPIRVEGWSPGNFDDQFLGPITVREAVARSINTVAVQVSEKAGRAQVIRAARRLGISSPLPPHPSIALGTAEVTPLELGGAYAGLAAGGIPAQPYAITEIRDSNGTLLYTRKGSPKPRVVSVQNMMDLNDLLTGVITSGTGKAAALDRPAAGKTGTSQDFRDAWFAGYTADLATVVWMGNDDNKPMRKVTGGGLPAQLWQKFMLAAHAGLPVRDLVVPPDEEIMVSSSTSPPPPRASTAPQNSSDRTALRVTTEGFVPSRD